MDSEMLTLNLLAAYVLLLIGQIVWLVRIGSGKKKKPGTRKYRYLFALEGICAVVSGWLIFVFDTLPGSGFMPGMTWLLAWLASIAAFGAYLLMAVITLVVYAVGNRKKKAPDSGDLGN